VAVTDRTLNSSLSRCKRDVAKDIIFLENDIDFVPNSFSPQARPLCDKVPFFAQLFFVPLFFLFYLFLM